MLGIYGGAASFAPPQVAALTQVQVFLKVFKQNKQAIQSTYSPISGRVDRASATEAVDLGSIPGWVKPKTIKIGIFTASWLDVEQLKRTV